MKKLVYFHGLESKQGGQKVDLLTRHFLSYAPSMNYEDQTIWKRTLKNVENIQPSYVIGSSMGGLMAFHSGYQLNCKLLLFNPAFERKDKYIAEEEQNYEGKLQKAEIEIILGKNDTEVNPESTIEFLNKTGIKAKVEYLELQHRIPYEVFESQIQKMLKRLSGQ